LIQVEWTSPEPRVRLQVRDVHGRVAQSHEVPLSDLAARGPVRD
jgi:hypothetical protein